LILVRLPSGEFRYCPRVLREEIELDQFSDIPRIVLDKVFLNFPKWFWAGYCFAIVFMAIEIYF